MNKLILLLPIVFSLTAHATIVDDLTVESSMTLSAGTASTVPYLNGSKQMTSSAVTPTELGYLSGVTSAIQTQLGGKQSTLVNSAGLAAALSDETGTGLAVFNSSPTIAGTASINAILMPATVSPAVSIRMNDTDSGFGSDADGTIYASLNGAERVRWTQNSATYGFLTNTFTNDVDIQGDLTVSTINGVAFPTTGNAMAFAGYDNSGNLTSVPNTTYTDYNGYFSNIQTPGSGDMTFMNLGSNAGVAPANVSGLLVNNQTDSTLNVTLADFNNTGAIGDDFNGLRVFNSGAATDGLTMQAIGNSATIGGQLRFMEASNTGDGQGGIFYNLSNSGDMGNNFQMLNVQESGAITGNDQIASFNKNSGSVSGQFNGIGLNLSADVGDTVQLLTASTSGAHTLSNGFIGANITSDAVVTGASNMMFLSDSGSASSKTGLSIQTTGSATGTVKGLEINLSGVTTPNKKVGIDINEGAFQAGYTLDSVSAPVSFSSVHSLGGALSITSGNPLSVPLFGNNIGYQIAAADDYTADNTLGAGNSLGFSLNGFINQVAVATGKTVDTINYMFAGGSNIDADTGTLENASMFRAAGIQNAGGGLTITNQRAFYVDPAFDNALGTNKFGFINASSTNNWFKGQVTVGGTTGVNPGYELHVTGDSLITGNFVVQGVADLGDGSVAVTQPALTNDTTIATTEYVDQAINVLSFGDVSSNTATSVDSEVALFSGTTGKLIKRATGTGFAKLTSGVLSTSATVDAATELSGVTPIANGGTNSSTALSGSSIMISNGSAIVQGAAGTSTTVLHGNASGAPTYGAVSLTADVSGTLPVGNGGTNNTSFLATGVVYGGAGGTSLTTDATSAFTYDATNKRLSLNGAGTGKINATVTSGTDSAITGFCTGTSNNCVSIQNQAAYTMQLTNAAASATAGGSLGFAFSRGTLASRTQSLAGDQLGSITAQGYTGSAFGPGLSGAISFVATENTTASANGSSLVFSTTANGSLAPTARMSIGQSGLVNITGLTASLPVQTDASKNLVSAAINLSGSQVTSTLGIANGGTGQTTASAAFGALSPLTTKGDLLGFSTVNARIPVGSDGQVLTADSTQALGLKWGAPPATTPASSNITGNTTGDFSVAHYYFADTTGGAFTFTLPAASSNDGKYFYVMNVTFGGSNDVSVARTGADTINGATSDTITAGQTKHYVSNGTNWFVF